MRTLAFIALLCLPGCASLGGDGGGGDNLPNRGFAPYLIVMDEDRNTVSVLALEPEDDRSLAEPSVLAIDDTTLALYIEVGDTLARATSTDGGRTFSPLQTVLQPEDDPRFGDHVGAPAVTRLDDGRWLMAFEFGARAGIGLAISTDGLDFTLVERPVVVPEEDFEAGGVASPTLVETDDGITVLYEAWAGEQQATVTLARADAASPNDPFVRRAGPIAPGSHCPPAEEAVFPCWDGLSMASPELDLATTSTGRQLWRLAYVGRSPSEGTRDSETTIGFLASEDGLIWSPYPFNPALTSPEGPLLEPSVLRFGDTYLLFFVQRQGTRAMVGLAINDDGQPSESF